MTGNISKLQFISILILLSANNYFAQQSTLSRAVNSITSYIATDSFKKLRLEIGDLASTDSIYIYALRVNNNDYSEALLSLMLATVPYQEVPIELPLVNTVLYYPLTSADHESFLRKNENLPAHLFIDSPESQYGDKDKLAHFFGSAFLSYESSIFDLGKLIGYFVEAFEENFKVQSAIDIRDIDVNSYGRLYGDLLKDNHNLLPSQVILLRSFRFLRITI